MEIIDNKNGVPIEYYRERFASREPEEMSKSSGVEYSDGAFRLVFLNRPVTLSWPDMEVVYTDDGTAAKPNVRLLLSRLVMEGAVIPQGGRMLSYTEMPWGNVYEAQFRGRCIMRLAFGFGFAPDKFRTACEAVGGVPAKGGDVAYDVSLVEGLNVRLMIWEGDDEFQPTAQILFSDNFPAAFTAEDMAVVGDVILDAMKGRW